MKKYNQMKRSLLILILLIFMVLLIGTLGFHYIAELDWIDAFYSASMFHSGLGPVYEMKTTSQKLFASFYAILAAVIFLSAVIYFISKIFIIEHL
jgi:hypothetical protein